MNSDFSTDAVVISTRLLERYLDINRIEMLKEKNCTGQYNMS
jgi:hypothetical protein